MKTASLVFGILSICGMLLGFMPCFGAFNWINIPFSLLGLIISIVAYTKAEVQPKTNAVVGIILCAIAVVFGFIRLVMGGGVV